MAGTVLKLRTALPLAALAGVLALTGCSPESGPGAGADPGARPDGSGAGPASRPDGSALAAVDTLAVKGRAPRTGYERERFGKAWADTDSNGCRTRDDILKRDLTETAFKGGDCKVATGTLAKDPYTGRRIPFERMRSTIDIDHVVALSDAWQKGARQWDGRKRVAFANDPLNLLAVDGPANRAKGDADAATWLPPYKPYRCAYVARQVAVKKKYGVWVTSGERAAMKRVLGGCAQEALPSGGNPTRAPQRYAPTEPGEREPGRDAHADVLLTPSGNHYQRGQLCGKARLGRTTRDAQGAELRCAERAGRPYWQ